MAESQPPPNASFPTQPPCTVDATVPLVPPPRNAEPLSTPETFQELVRQAEQQAIKPTELGNNSEIAHNDVSSKPAALLVESVPHAEKNDAAVEEEKRDNRQVNWHARPLIKTSNPTRCDSSLSLLTRKFTNLMQVCSVD